MTVPLVFNPRSGPRGKDPQGILRKLPSDLRNRVEPIPMSFPWDWTESIERAQLASSPLLVWGGDGTLHSAGRALAQAASPVPLAAIPGGSGNGLVRGLGTPLDPAKALIGLLRGSELRLDLPRLDGEPFFNLCGTGFEAAVAESFEREPGRGFRTYARVSLQLWRSFEPFGIRWDGNRRGQDLPSSAWSLCLANLPQYGSGLWIAPTAHPFDGLLEVVTLERPALMGFPELAALFRKQGRSALRKTGRLQSTTLFLERPLPWHVDGETLPPRDRAEISLEPLAFRMQVTNGCPWST